MREDSSAILAGSRVRIVDTIVFYDLIFVDMLIDTVLDYV